MISYDEDSYKESGDEPYIISCVLAFITLLGFTIWIMLSFPDDSIESHIVVPLWVFLIYVIGIITTSAFIAFIVFFISEYILDKIDPGKYKIRKIREPKVKRTYKF